MTSSAALDRPVMRPAVLFDPSIETVRLVPEPGTLMLLGAGIVGFAAFIRLDSETV